MHSAFGLGGLLMCLFTLALLFGLFYLARTGRLGGPWGRYGRGYPRPGSPDDGVNGPHATGPWAGPWGAQAAPKPEDEALKVLADRLAKGDITPDEYTERVNVLRQMQQ